MTATRRRSAASLAIGLIFLMAATHAAAAFAPDKAFLADRALLDTLQRDAFAYFWHGGEPNSGMAYEANYDWDIRPVAVGGTGFGIAALVAAVDREWVGRGEASSRLMKIVSFLENKTQRRELHGALPHWINGETGETVAFGDRDAGADLVETSLLMQGLLIARAYFNGPGVEARLRAAITRLWEDVEWDWFANGEDNGLYWHWDPDQGFHHGLKILGYNECLITYVLAISSPTHPISRAAYDYWTSGPDYQTRILSEYVVEAAPSCGGPLFMAQYSFIGLDPRQLADGYVKRGYFVRSVKQTLANRAYCLYEAPEENRYSEAFWGLTASQTPIGYASNSPCNDNGAVAPTAAVSSLPFTPHYSLQVLHTLAGGLKKKVWGEYGPFDAVSLRDDWVSQNYLAIDQLPMAAMAENYRSGLLWRLFMADTDIRRGLDAAGLRPPEHPEGFPEVVSAYRKDGGRLFRDAYDIRRHPDSGLYEIPFTLEQGGPAAFRLLDAAGDCVLAWEGAARKGANVFRFAQCLPPTDEILILEMRTARTSHSLALRLH